MSFSYWRCMDNIVVHLSYTYNIPYKSLTSFIKIVQIDMIVIFFKFIIKIFHYYMFTHPWYLLNLTSQNLYQKMQMSFVIMNAIWKSFLKKPHEIHMWMKTLLEIFKKCLLSTKFLRCKKKFHLKGLLKIRSNFSLSKIHNYHSRTKVKVWKKKIS
jgi:hypothetical protein